MLAAFPGAQRRPGYEARPVHDRNTFMEDLDNLLGGSFEEFSALNNLSLNGGWLPWMKLPPPCTTAARTKTPLSEEPIPILMSGHSLAVMTPTYHPLLPHVGQHGGDSIGSNSPDPPPHSQ